MTKHNTNMARWFLLFNALFSALVGLELLLFTPEVISLLFVDTASWQALTLRCLGVGLLLFASYLLLLAANRFLQKPAVMLIVYADIAWLVITALIVVIDGYLFTEQGILIIDVIALVVVICAVGQFIGAKKITPPQSHASVNADGDAILASVSRKVTVPAKAVWDVMTDHPGYADVANNLSKVEVVSGDGLGMVRRCYGPKGEHWTETCDGFMDNQYFSFTIHTEAEDYPYPFEKLRGRWSVKPLGDAAEFTIDIVAQPKGNWLARCLITLGVKHQFKGVMIDLADAWAVRMESRASS